MAFVTLAKLYEGARQQSLAQNLYSSLVLIKSGLSLYQFQDAA